MRGVLENKSGNFNSIYYFFYFLQSFPMQLREHIKPSPALNEGYTTADPLPRGSVIIVHCQVPRGKGRLKTLATNSLTADFSKGSLSMQGAHGVEQFIRQAN
jgi:hypothetical protein